MSEHRAKPIPEYKQQLVATLAENMKNSRTVLVASCKGLPGQQFHDIKKQLRGKADVKVARRSAVLRAIDATEKGAMQDLKEQYASDSVLLFSSIDPFELSGVLTDSQSETKAKAGDIAPYDIVIEPGPTDLVPGPAISELGAVGLKVAVKDGKLEIQNQTTVTKEGGEIDEKVAGVLAKLNILPMKVGFLPLAAYDSQDDKTYVGIRINKEETYEEMKTLIGKALGFATKVGYIVKENLSYFLATANAEEKALQALVDSKAEAPAEEPAQASETETPAAEATEDAPAEATDPAQEEKTEVPQSDSSETTAQESPEAEATTKEDS